MLQINPRNDIRYDNVCCYCQKAFEDNKTRDHIPSKVLLDEPFPENLPIAFCCENCNKDFSTDEEYFACIIEYLIAGTKDIDEIEREKIKDILFKKQHLKIKIEENIIVKHNSLTINFTDKILDNVLKKLIYGHLSFELSNPFIEQPNYVEFNTINSMSDSKYNSFMSDFQIDIVPEIGTRASLDYIVLDENPISTWKIVQEDNYQYKIEILDSETKLKIIIRNKIYLLAVWKNKSGT